MVWLVGEGLGLGAQLRKDLGFRGSATSAAALRLCKKKSSELFPKFQAPGSSKTGNETPQPRERVPSKLL